MKKLLSILSVGIVLLCANVFGVIINTENFNSGAANYEPIITAPGGWKATDIIYTNRVWCYYTHSGKEFARMSGYDTQPEINEDWLISPAMDFDLYTDVSITFSNTAGYVGNQLQLMVSSNFTGGDPNGAGVVWSDETGNVIWDAMETPAVYNWVSSGDVDLSSYNGSSVYVAFKYTSTASETATWQVDDIIVTGIPEPAVALILLPFLALLRRK